MKKLSVFFILSCITANVFAEFVFAPVKQNTQFLEYTFSHSQDYGFEGKQTFFSIEYSYESENFCELAGFQSTKDIWDLTFDTSYLPFVKHTQTKTRSMGASFLYHVQFHPLYTENDFLLLYRCRWNHKSGLYFNADAGLFYKVTDIENLAKNLTELGPMFAFDVSKKFDFGTRIYFDLKFHSLYRYPTFGNTFYTLGVMQHFNKMAVGLEGEVSFTDQIVTVNHTDSLLFRFKWRIAL